MVECGLGWFAGKNLHQAELPKVIEKLEAEIAKLEGLMVDPALFTADPDKFQKASDALVARHEMLSDAEAEWMELGG